MIKIFNIRYINELSIINSFHISSSPLLVVPSGPGLSEIDRNAKYYEALQQADLALPDSGLMVLLVRLFTGKKIEKLSGPKFLAEFLKQPELQFSNTLFLVDSSAESSDRNRQYLNSLGIPLTLEYQYIAPVYDHEDIIDPALINRLESLKDKPKYILINLGGGVQERLGLHIKNHLSYPVTIICTGAAIAFFTGEQAKLPAWVDRIYMGWLYRIIHDPRRFLIRYLKAFRLVWIFIKYRKYILSYKPIPQIKK